MQIEKNMSWMNENNVFIDKNISKLKFFKMIDLDKSFTSENESILN